MPPPPRSGPGSAALNWRPHYLVTQDPKPPTKVYAGKEASESAATRLALNSLGGVVVTLSSAADAAAAGAFRQRHPRAVRMAAGAEQRFAVLAAAEAAAGSGRVPTRFVPLGVLIAYGMLPRFGSKAGFVHPLTGEPNANLCRSRESFDPKKTTFVFVSHRWLLPGNGARGHPDDDQQRKFQLIVAALRKLCGGSNTPVPEGMEVAVWVDYCCIDQDGAPASELDNLGGLIQACDLVLTPVVDVDHQEWDYPELVNNWFVEYLAAGWKEYWSRGWCRVEAMCAAVKPVDEGRAELFRGAVKVQLLAGHRPHVLFGTKELEERRPVIFLPPLLHSMFERYAPELGALTKEADRVAVRRLTEEARKDIKELVGGVGGRLGGRSPGRGAGWHPGRGGAAARAAKRGKAGGRQTDGKVLHLRGGAPLSRIC